MIPSLSTEGYTNCGRGPTVNGLTYTQGKLINLHHPARWSWVLAAYLATITIMPPSYMYSLQTLSSHKNTRKLTGCQVLSDTLTRVKNLQRQHCNYVRLRR